MEAGERGIDLLGESISPKVKPIFLGFWFDDILSLKGCEAKHTTYIFHENYSVKHKLKSIGIT